MVLWRRRPVLSFNIFSTHVLQQLEQIRHQSPQKRRNDSHRPPHVGHRQPAGAVRHTSQARLSRLSAHRRPCDGHARNSVAVQILLEEKLLLCSSGKMDDVRAVAQVAEGKLFFWRAQVSKYEGIMITVKSRFFVVIVVGWLSYVMSDLSTLHSPPS